MVNQQGFSKVCSFENLSFDFLSIILRAGIRPMTFNYEPPLWLYHLLVPVFLFSLSNSLSLQGIVSTANNGGFTSIRTKVRKQE